MFDTTAGARRRERARIIRLERKIYYNNDKTENKKSPNNNEIIINRNAVFCVYATNVDGTGSLNTRRIYGNRPVLAPNTSCVWDADVFDRERFRTSTRHAILKRN